ncbi:protease inhibitor carrapatin-like [Drosophila madeirensis]|uniref:Protease inhibitor carrapatin-like n=1 Tax=Drosophila madeirensis TaxID=30013 RepID=A0AAU9F4L0_DROMD
MFLLRIAIVSMVVGIVYATETKDPFRDNWFREIREKLHNDVCLQKPSYGKCKGNRRLWYFNALRIKCESFIYSNCGGNHNRFHSYEECHEFCNRHDPDTIYKSLQMNDWVLANNRK